MDAKVESISKPSQLDELFASICQQLRNYDKQLSSNFLKMTNNFDRFKFVWHIGLMHTKLDALLATGSKSEANARHYNPKDDTRAHEMRMQGNEVFKSKRFYEALIRYNDCMRLACVAKKKAKKTPREEASDEEEEGSEIAFAYANRSAVFFQMGEFQLCLNDIDTAFKYDYPQRLRQKLVERKINCLFQLRRYKRLVAFMEANLDPESIGLFKEKLEQARREEKQEEEKANEPSATGAVDDEHETGGCEGDEGAKKKSLFENYGEISFELAASKRNTRIPSASSSLTIDYSFEQGFFLKATRPIHVGEIVVDEAPYASVLLGHYAESHCFECMQPLNLLKMNVAHCQQCSRVTYCGVECARRAWRSHHRVECRFLNLLLDGSTVTHMEWLALRVVLKAGLERLKSLRATLLAHEAKYETNYRRDEDSMRFMRDIVDQYNSDDYLPIFNLVTNSAARTTSDLFRRSFVAMFLVKLAAAASGHFFDEDDPTRIASEEACFVGGLVLRHLQSIACNAHECSRLQLANSETKAMEKSRSVAVGAGLYALLSLFNHSCDPDVTRYFRGSQCQVRALRRIAPGEDVCDNYGLVYAVNEVHERQQRLLEQYFFACQCRACLGDWPLYAHLPSELDALDLRCDECVQQGRRGNGGGQEECTACLREADNMKLEQVKSHEALKVLLAFNLRVVLSDASIVSKIERLYGQFVAYVERLQARGVRKPFRDYNVYEEALKQCINFINMR